MVALINLLIVATTSGKVQHSNYLTSLMKANAIYKENGFIISLLYKPILHFVARI